MAGRMMRFTPAAPAILAVALCLAGPGDAAAQNAAAPSAPRRLGRVSLFSTVSKSSSNEREPWTENAFNTSLTFGQPVALDESSADFGLDLRYSAFSMSSRPARTSLYEAFAGTALSEGLRVRAGHMWLDDLGSLGSLAGGLVEYRPGRTNSKDGRVRVGAFGGLEPNILEFGYAPDVRKFGGYVTYEGDEARHDTLGYVLIRNGATTERSVISATNYVPVGRRLFLYQASEYDVSAPAGRADGGLTYMFASARVLPAERFDVQALYHRGRSIDARGLLDSLSSGRPLAPQALTGLLYESVGARASFNGPVTIAGAPAVYGGYYRDRNAQDAPGVDRWMIGGQLSQIAGRGLDLTLSDSKVGQPTGAYHSRYVSLGAQVRSWLYVSGDYSTSLSVVRFLRTSGIVVETRPRATRWSANANGNLTRTLGLLIVAERSHEDDYQDVRVLSGLTYRLP